MYEPCILKKELQYSCDLCGELPIIGKRWCCNVCEDFGAWRRNKHPALKLPQQFSVSDAQHPLSAFSHDF